jgi:cytoskeleton protein RodZ
MNIGSELRQARESRGLSIDAVAATTRIRANVLAGIERQDLSALPPRPYARGFVAAYAREVGLDPTETVQGYFAQFELPPAEVQLAPTTPRVSKEGRRRFRTPAVGLVLLLVAIVAISQWSAEVRNTAEPGAVATSGTNALPAITPVAAAMGSTAARTPAEPVPLGPALVIVLETQRPSWISATADGTRVIYRTVPAGTKEILHGSEAITIRAGDAGAIRWSVNGRDPTVMGAPGEVRTVRVTRADATGAR